MYKYRKNSFPSPRPIPKKKQLQIPTLNVTLKAYNDALCESSRRNEQPPGINPLNLLSGPSLDAYTYIRPQNTRR